MCGNTAVTETKKSFVPGKTPFKIPQTTSSEPTESSYPRLMIPKTRLGTALATFTLYSLSRLPQARDFALSFLEMTVIGSYPYFRFSRVSGFMGAP